jgi:hypothetical protein
MRQKNDGKTLGSRLASSRLLSRRVFVKATGAAATVVTTGLASSTFASTELPRVNEDEPMATALNYVHDARTVDAAKRLSDRFCHNCALFAGTPDDEWEKCSIFPGKVVAAEGWCSAWAPKPNK